MELVLEFACGLSCLRILMYFLINFYIHFVLILNLIRLKLIFTQLNCSFEILEILHLSIIHFFGIYLIFHLIFLFPQILDLKIYINLIPMLHFPIKLYPDSHFFYLIDHTVEISFNNRHRTHLNENSFVFFVKHSLVFLLQVLYLDFVF